LLPVHPGIVNFKTAGALSVELRPAGR